MLRLFTGLELPPDIRLDLKMMQGGVVGARWTEASSFHVTLRFMGDIDDDLARDVAEELDRLEMKPFSLCLRGLDIFGGNRPHAIIAQIAESADLRRLQLSHERLCQTLGLEPEPRKFIPHVTLARLRDPDPRDLRNFIESHALYRSRDFSVKSFVLFSSRPLRGGGPYAVEETYAMAGA